MWRRRKEKNGKTWFCFHIECLVHWRANVCACLWCDVSCTTSKPIWTVILRTVSESEMFAQCIQSFYVVNVCFSCFSFFFHVIVGIIVDRVDQRAIIQFVWYKHCKQNEYENMILLLILVFSIWSWLFEDIERHQHIN